jgi:hypothetical protein
LFGLQLFAKHLSKYAAFCICNAETSFFTDTRQYFVNEDDTVPQKVCKVVARCLAPWWFIDCELTSSCICSYRLLFRRIAGGGFTSVVQDPVRG